MHCLRHRPIGSKKAITSLGLATHLDSDWRSFKQLEGYVEGHSRVTVFELEFDLADRLDGSAAGSAYFALIDGHLNQRGRTWTDCNHRSRDRRGKNWTQLLFTNSVQ
jgi:hypothetical protein